MAVKDDMVLIKRGAEAEIYRGDYLGRNAVVKWRLPRSYRHPALDRALRATRTKKEINMLREVRALGIGTPIIYDIDLEEGIIVMEYIDGVRMKDMLNNPSVHKCDKKEACLAVGEAIGLMHANGYIHGDLTTSNVILLDGVPYFIDFSLGTKSRNVEDMGVDLRVFEEAYRSTHPTFQSGWESVIEGYRAANPTLYSEVMARLEAIKRRRRYVG